VQVYDGPTLQLIRNFYAFAATFSGGVYVAAADVNGDGLADIITGAGPGGGPQVNVYNGSTSGLLSGFFANLGSGGAFRLTGGTSAGVRVGASTTKANVQVLTVPGPGASAVVDAFSSSLAFFDSFLAFDPAFTGGAYVAG
jgi:hypothetical protein